MRESTIWKECLLALGKIPGVRIFRNNVGTGWVGKSTRLKAGQTYVAAGGEVVIHNARPLQAGLFVGSGDGIGWRTVTITPDMVGKQFAQFVSLETKTSAGRIRPEQATWAKNVTESGGVAIIARSPDDLINGFMQGNIK